MNRGRLKSIVWKEFIQMRRDRATLGMLIGIPIFQLMLFGYAIRQDVRNLPTVVFDMSRTQESREFKEAVASRDGKTFSRIVNEAKTVLKMSLRTAMTYLKRLAENGLIRATGGLCWSREKAQ